MPRRLHTILSLILCACALAAARAQEERVQPGAAGELSATIGEDGSLRIENELLRIVLTPSDRAGASSIVWKPTQTELAVCDTYNRQHFKAFIECLHVQGMREGRIDRTDGSTYPLVALSVTDKAITARFRGRPVDGHGAYDALVLTKTYVLRAGESRLDIELAYANKSTERLPIGVWLQTGLRVTGQGIDAYAPSPAGVVTRGENWADRQSSFILLPTAGGGWTAAVGRDTPRLALWLAAGPTQVETIIDWLAKFFGFSLGFGTPVVDVEPGESLTIPYSFAVAQGMPAVHGATPELACGLALPGGAPRTGARFEVIMAGTAPASTKATYTLSARRLPDGKPVTLAEQTLPLTAGHAMPVSFFAEMDREGTWVLTGTIKAEGNRSVTAERTVILGAPSGLLKVDLPKLAGAPFWVNRATARGFKPTVPAAVRENALLEQLHDRVKDAAWKKQDPHDENLTWYGVRGGVAMMRENDKSLDTFQGLPGQKNLKVTGIAFGPKRVWLATNNGLLAWQRDLRYWTRFAVNGVLMDVPVTKIETVEDKVLRLTVAHKDKPRNFEFDLKTQKWVER